MWFEITVFFNNMYAEQFMMEVKSQSSTPIENTNEKSTPPSLICVLSESSTPTPIFLNDAQTPIKAPSMDVDTTMYNPKKLKSIPPSHGNKLMVNGKQKCYNCKMILSGKLNNGTNHLHDHLNRCPKLA